MGDADNISNSQFEWNLLPPEIKAYCVKKMNFKTKAGLRCSSKTDMQLVDSVKHPFEKVHIYLELEEREFFVSVEGNDGDFAVAFRKTEKKSSEGGSVKDEKGPVDLSTENPEEFERVANFMKQVLKADIDDLQLNIDLLPKASKIFLDTITQGPLLSVKQIEIFLDDDETIAMETLKHCSTDSLASVALGGSYESCMRSIEEFLRLPQVVNAQKLLLKPCLFDSFTKRKQKMVKACIENWTKNGSSKKQVLQIGFLVGTPTIDEFVEILNLSTIRRHEYAILLRTENPSKQIWVRDANEGMAIQVLFLDANSEEPDFKKMILDEKFVFKPPKRRISDSDMDWSVEDEDLEDEEPEDDDLDGQF